MSGRARRTASVVGEAPVAPSSTISSLSSQFLESRWVPWGTIPFHLGIIVLFFGHLIPVLMPGVWQSLVSRRTALLTVEAIGIAPHVVVDGEPRVPHDDREEP